MLRTRLWTAAVALPATIAIVLLAPAGVFTAFIAILTSWGLFEIVAMTKANLGETFVVAIFGIFCALAALWLSVCMGLDPAGRNDFITMGEAFAIGVTIVMLLLVVAVARRGTEQISRMPSVRYVLQLVGALWVGVLFPYFALLRNLPGGIPIIVMMLLLVVASDSGAYFAGRALGRTKLLPRVSPNKTIEGAIGGLAACVMAGIILRPLLAPHWSVEAAVIMAAVVGVLAQFGDAVGSAFKRVAGVKDSGWIFPGHGGLLDRTCSLVFAAAFTYYYLCG